MSLPESRLCDYLASLEARELSFATRDRLGQALLDWFTAGWSGAALPSAMPLRELAHTLFPGTGGAPTFGAASNPVPLTPLGSAFANAAITHLREIDDAHRSAMLHPGIVAVSPVLALTTAVPMSNQRFMAAILAGYEVALRIGETLGSTHSGRFHATATAGSVGAAAAAAVALGLDRTQLHHALGIAATQAAGLWQFVDDNAHESKALHPAFAVRNGMSAAYAAQAGFPGAQAFVTGKRGLYALLHGDGPLAAIDAALGETDRLCEATIKAWPTCGQLFTALDATQAIIDKWAPDAADIASVDIAIFPQALRIAGVDWPSKASETCFSGRYCIATLLLKRRLGIAETEAPDFALPGLQALADKTVIRAESSYAAAFPNRRPCTVTIKMKDGKEFSMLRDLRRGDPEDPFDWPQLEARLRAFAPTVPEPVAQSLGSWCASFATVNPEEGFAPPPAAFYGVEKEKAA